MVACRWPTFSGSQADLQRARSSLLSLSFNALDFSVDDLTVLIGELFQLVLPLSLASSIPSTNARPRDSASPQLLPPAAPREQLDLERLLRIPLAAARSFILSARAGMPPTNPYHNWTHVADVTQASTGKGRDAESRTDALCAVAVTT